MLPDLTTKLSLFSFVVFYFLYNHTIYIMINVGLKYVRCEIAALERRLQIVYFTSARQDMHWPADSGIGNSRYFYNLATVCLNDKNISVYYSY